MACIPLKVTIPSFIVFSVCCLFVLLISGGRRDPQPKPAIVAFAINQPNYKGHLPVVHVNRFNVGLRFPWQPGQAIYLCFGYSTVCDSEQVVHFNTDQSIWHLDRRMPIQRTAQFDHELRHRDRIYFDDECQTLWVLNDQMLTLTRCKNWRFNLPNAIRSNSKQASIESLECTLFPVPMSWNLCVTLENQVILAGPDGVLSWEEESGCNELFSRDELSKTQAVYDCNNDSKLWQIARGSKGGCWLMQGPQNCFYSYIDQRLVHLPAASPGFDGARPVFFAEGPDSMLYVLSYTKYKKYGIQAYNTGTGRVRNIAIDFYGTKEGKHRVTGMSVDNRGNIFVSLDPVSLCL